MREKEKKHRLSSYANLMLKSHAGDLFEVECTISDVLGSAGSVCPDLTAHLRHAATRQSEPMDVGLPMGYIPMADLITLYQLLAYIHTIDCEYKVDNMRIYWKDIFRYTVCAMD